MGNGETWMLLDKAPVARNISHVSFNYIHCNHVVIMLQSCCNHTTFLWVSREGSCGRGVTGTGHRERDKCPWTPLLKARKVSHLLCYHRVTFLCQSYDNWHFIHMDNWLSCRDVAQWIRPWTLNQHYQVVPVESAQSPVQICWQWQ